jgi:hypothetical protein
MAERVNILRSLLIGNIWLIDEEQIQEYLDHGRTVRAAYEDNPETRAVAAFGKIYGVGPALAHHLVSLGARTYVGTMFYYKKRMAEPSLLGWTT